MSNPETPSTPSTPALDDALRWRLAHFRPRRPMTPRNDAALEAFLSGAIDYTRPNNTDPDTEDGTPWT